MVAHYEPPHQDLCYYERPHLDLCGLPIQLFSTLVLKELISIKTDFDPRNEISLLPLAKRPQILVPIHYNHIE